MNEKKARRLRKLSRYKVGKDPKRARKYSVLPTYKKMPVGRAKTGHMIATKDERLKYRTAKKMYKHGLLPKERV